MQQMKYHAPSPLHIQGKGLQSNACNGVNGTSRKLHEIPYLKLGSITADFQEFADGVYEPLVVVVTHPLNFLVMVLDVIR